MWGFFRESKPHYKPGKERLTSQEKSRGTSDHRCPRCRCSRSSDSAVTTQAVTARDVLFFPSK